MDQNTKYPISLLIVEDELELKNILRDYLRPNVHSIYTAANGIEALEILKNHTIDCIFSDIAMPKMNGIKLLQAAKEINSQMIVIFYTAFESEELIRQAAYHGAYKFIAKPKPFEEIRDALFEGFDHFLKSEAVKEEDTLKQYQSLIGLDKNK